MVRLRRAIVAAIVASAALVVVTVAPRRLADWLWFRDLGLERVFFTKIAAQWILGPAAAAVSFVTLFANANLAVRGAALKNASAGAPVLRDVAAPPSFRGKLADILVLPGCIALAALFGLVAASQWRTAVLFLFRTPFGVVDPVYARDIGFYVFTQPALEQVIDFADALLLFAALVAVLPTYVMRRQVVTRKWWVRVEPRARTHLTALGAALLLLWGLRVKFVSLPGLLFSNHGPLVGASYTDLSVRLPAFRVLATLLVLAAAALAVAVRVRALARLAFPVGVAVGAFALLGAIVWPAAYQRLVVQPDELVREAPQIAHHIEATRRAWRLDSVSVRDLNEARGLTLQDVATNRATIQNIRLWDREPLLQTYGQLQSIRPYYDFVAVDDDRYWIDGEYRQVLLSARELNSAALPVRRFINERLTFTHGMGLALGPSNQVTEEGLPLLFIKDLPPVSTVSVRVARPQIYFGELSNDYVVVRTKQREFDYPAREGDSAISTRFEGKGGVSIGTLGRRLLFALRFRSLNLLLSREITGDSRILYYRTIQERAQKALPFLRFDYDPYLVITGEGRLRWICDAYTSSDRYPYAQRLSDGTTYMRNSVKVVIDAYDGAVDAYVSDSTDPMVQTLAKIYRGVLKPLSAMPADLRVHVRYPEDLFQVQSALYATFHMSDPETFYHREDQWQVPGAAANPRAFIRHMVMRLPGEDRPEFILMRPFTPRQKDNLAAWMVARNDGDRYGQLVVYRFPRQSLVYGPTQVANRINQDTEIARQLSLWGQRGTEVLRGEMLVIPIGESLIYVQPLYLRAQDGRIPELKRVIVAYQNRVAMEETLDAGLARLFGNAGANVVNAAPAREGGTSAAELVRRALEHYERARAAQRVEDWALYGAEMRQLGAVLEELNQLGARPGKP